MPHVHYQYHGPGGAIANCIPPLGAAVAGPGMPGPNLIGLANTAGAALPGLAGMGGAGAGLGAVPAAAGRIPYTWAGLCAAALFVGLYPPGPHPAYEMRHRVSNLRMAAFTAVGGHLAPVGPVFGSVTTNERVCLAYHMGMNLAAYAAKAANFLFPMHFGRWMTAGGGPGVACTIAPAFAVAMWPDLVFADPANGACQIWEAKGRSGAAALGGFAAAGVPALLNVALGQTCKVATALVAGVLVAPNARIASVARLDPVTGRWFLQVTDPAQKRRAEDEPGEDRDRRAFYDEFYRPFLAMVAGSRRTVSFGGSTFLVRRIPGTNVRVGVDQRIVAALTGRSLRARTDSRSSPSGPPETVAERIERYVAAGYPQDPANPNRFVSQEGILTEAAEDDITRPPART